MALDIGKLDSGLLEIFDLDRPPKEGDSDRPLDTNEDFAKEFVDMFMDYFMDVEAELTHPGERVETPGTAMSPGPPEGVADPDFDSIKIIRPLAFDDPVLKHELTRDLEASILATLDFMDKGTREDPRFGWQLFFRGLGDSPTGQENDQGWLQEYWTEQKAIFDDAINRVTERILVEEVDEILPWIQDRSIDKKNILKIQSKAVGEAKSGLPEFIKRLTEWGSADAEGYYLDGVSISIPDDGVGMYKDLYMLHEMSVEDSDLLKKPSHAATEYTNIIHNGLTGETESSSRGVPTLQPSQMDSGARLFGVFTNVAPGSMFPAKSTNIASGVPAVPLAFTQVPGPAAPPLHKAAPSAPDPKLPGPPADNTTDPGILIR